MSNEEFGKKLLTVLRKQKPPAENGAPSGVLGNDVPFSFSIEDTDEKFDDMPTLELLSSNSTKADDEETDLRIINENSECDLPMVPRKSWRLGQPSCRLGQPQQKNENRVSFIEKVHVWDGEVEAKLERLRSDEDILLESPGPAPIARSLLLQSLDDMERSSRGNSEETLKVADALKLPDTENEGITRSLVCTPLRKSTRISQNFNAARISLRMSESLKVRTDKVKEDYAIYEEIGKGSFGKVRRGACRESRKKVAIKRIRKRKLDKLNESYLENEIRILRAIKHENIVALYDVYGSNKHMTLIMEFCDGGDVFDWLDAEDHLDEVTVAIVLKQVVGAVRYLHDVGVVHRDLKLENLLLVTHLNASSFRPTVKIADFGFATTIKHPDEKIEGTCGSLNYIAPEVLTGKVYSKQCDLWSLGVIVYAMLGGYLPFCGEEPNSRHETYKKIQQGEYTFGEEVWVEVSVKAKGMVGGLLTVDPVKRLGCGGVQNHQWLKDCSEIEANRELIPSDDERP